MRTCPGKPKRTSIGLSWVVREILTDRKKCGSEPEKRYMTQQYFNLQQFLQSLANDEELGRELLAAFMEDSPVRKDSLGAALDAGDADSASKLAHSLKGMCGVVRANVLVDAALSMEHTAKNGELEKTRETYAEFVKMMEQVHAEIQSYLA